LTPGRYVGSPEVEEDDESFEEKMKRLTAKLEQQFAQGTGLQQRIREQLRGLGYGG
jgi:type I restriction enzyme M protein